MVIVRRVDVILVMKWNESFVLELARLVHRMRIPIIYDLWVARYFWAQRDQKDVEQWYQTERKIIEQCDHLLALTAPYKEFYIETYGCLPEKISVVPLAVDDVWLQRPPSTKQPHADSNFVVGYWGYVHKHHGIDVALAAARVLQSQSEIQFWFFGPDELLATILKAEGLPNTRLVGYVPSRFALIGAIDDVDISLGHLLLSHDAHLVLPNKAMEGMARGKVVLHADSEPMRALYAESNLTEESVRFFKGGSAEELAGAILELYRNPQIRDAVGKQAQLKMQTDHSEGTVKMALQGIMERL